ncbi:MAG: glycine--tRNA ligase subunit beta [Alphaproteobacteria bacterium RIFCSPHIGHO2_01_FULL_41_14]|nr:MAG: glycine--tRNA ligase subunit beta [Alphaproteobacteria bacterium GWB1_45_5]OFW75905.1 MAG: glycine--tRNA ligase subunit beta [Alphaproteobacteria bacterium GWA1_45_9]OFW89998.1 MAG: glycine--tRNA ligase subunit beta [Alphaproteobacteria bacterium RIFCSPHIGHO2_01_FULL_41_14]HCI48810.1 glycine--tRNA ligase subunit beta [Holosporales bacterium]
MSEFLVELFSEEIPAAFQTLAQAQLAHTFELKLKKENIPFDTIKAFGTPRRMGMVITGLPSVQADRSEERRGPQVNAPAAAIDGFLKSIQKQRHECEEKYMGDKGPFLIATLHERGKPTAEILATFIKETLENFEWPKSMRWKSDDFLWARPLHGILALFEGQVVPVKLEQLAIRSGASTFGHRFLSPHRLDVKNYADYKLQLAENYVQIDPLDRQASIREQITKLLAHKGLTLEEDSGLLEETANLVEWPVVLRGTIDKRFTSLPEEVLMTSMRVHQRYFSTRDSKGKLASSFLIVSNMETADQGQQIIDGNERVLRARLSDAHFFWAQDMRRPLSDWNKPLTHRIFQEKLGTLADKIERLQKTSALLLACFPTVDPKQAEQSISLLKADLSTSMVGEFPELQGIMGSHYAKAQGINPNIALAIREHYAPVGPQDICPKADLSVHVALVDKLDTLVGFFAVGLEPTASKDPYALRRTALGIIRLIHENELPMSIDELIKVALTPYTFPQAKKEKAALKIKAFIQDRLVVYLKQLYSASLLNAVLRQGGNLFITDLNLKLSALKAFLESPDGPDFITVYKRAANILKQEGALKTEEINSQLFVKEEHNLFDAILATQTVLDVCLADPTPHYAKAIQTLASLKAPLEVFFSNVRVQDPDPLLRHNRLSLLKRIEVACSRICDLEKL